MVSFVFAMMDGLPTFTNAFLFPAIGAEWATSPLAIVALAVAGTLFPIPTGAEIPIVQTMMGFGRHCCHGGRGEQRVGAPPGRAIVVVGAAGEVVAVTGLAEPS